MRYIIFGEFFDELSAESTGRGYHLSSKIGDNVDFLELPASALNHFDDGSAFCADTSDGSFYITSRVVFSIGSEDTGSDCKLGVRTVSTGPGLQGDGMHLLEFEFC